MMAMATIIASATLSAAIEIESRGMAAVKCACASRPVTPSTAESGRASRRAVPKMMAGTSSATPMMIAKAEA